MSVYLETHVLNDPFAEGRAERAVTALRRYARNLSRQLDLSFDDGSTVELAIDDRLAGGSDDRFTIHRLYWELLEESQALRLGSYKLRVRRLLSPSISAVASVPYRRPLGPIPLAHVKRTINILHIAARNRETSNGEPTDISPYMALGILAQISEHLQRHQCPLRLNITTIRPGSFDALTQHVERLEKEGKRGTYHLVHLDVHGESDEKDGASLFFESPSGKRTQKHSSSKVSQVLSRLSAEFAVVNACRSARADAGHDGNTAAIFTCNGGADNVLAMIFETLSGVAKTFLRAFYTEFLLRGATFGEAAGQGRVALRKHNSRKGELGQTLTLLDWFIPAVYSSVQNLAIAAPVDSPVANMMWRQGPVGRDCDVAALEKILLKRRVAFLHGHAWIRKTAFLHYCEGDLGRDRVCRRNSLRRYFLWRRHRR